MLSAVATRQSSSAQPFKLDERQEGQKRREPMLFCMLIDRLKCMAALTNAEEIPRDNG